MYYIFYGCNYRIQRIAQEITPIRQPYLLHLCISAITLPVFEQTAPTDSLLNLPFFLPPSFIHAYSIIFLYNTLVCYGYPLALVQHFQDRKYTITEITSGVFNIQKELMLPILLINIPELPALEYAWVTNIGPASPKISYERVPAYALDLLKPTFYKHKIRGIYNGHLTS